MNNIRPKDLANLMYNKCITAMKQGQNVEVYIITPHYKTFLARGKIINITPTNHDDLSGYLVEIDTKQKLTCEQRKAFDYLKKMKDLYGNKGYQEKFDIFIENLDEKTKKKVKHLNVFIDLLKYDLGSIISNLETLFKLGEKGIITFYTDFSEILMKFEYDLDTKKYQ